MMSPKWFVLGLLAFGAGVDWLGWCSMFAAALSAFDDWEELGDEMRREKQRAE